MPTFRGQNGLWCEYKPEELATPEAFARDPKLVWEWYNWRRELIAAEMPLQGQHIQCLLGRDLLASGMLIYSGLQNLYTLQL